jgi:hypothetical protein
MKTHYQLSTSDFAINGVIAVSMSDEIRKQLDGKQEFLDEKSKEVQVYLEAVKEREAEALVKAEAAQLAADEREALDEIFKEKFADELAARRKEKQAARQAALKSAKAK